MHANHFRARDGFALPAALLAMVVIGAIITGGFFVSSQEHSVSVSTDLGAQAMYLAEHGLQESLAFWRSADLRNLGRDSVTTFPAEPVMNGSSELGTFQIRAMPLGGRIYMLESEGRVQRGHRTAVRRVGVFVRSGTAQAPYASALTVYGEFARQGNSYVDGNDQCDADNAVAGVMALDSSLVSGEVRGNDTMIAGDPSIDWDPEMTQDSLSQFGDLNLAELIASADLRYPGGSNMNNMEPVATATGRCDLSVSDPDNWGEPLEASDSRQVAACADHYPIIASDGDMTIRTGRGQGILIVQGDLTITGNFEFSGVVIVTGSFSMRGTGMGTGKINGTVIVQGEGQVDTESGTSGNAMVQYNSCKVEDAFNAGLRIRPLSKRAWVSDVTPLPAGT